MLDPSAWQSCQGIAALHSWVSRKRRPIFLDRNLRTVLQAYTTKENQPRDNINILQSEDEELIVRPAKRRRKYSPQNTNQSQSGTRPNHNRQKIDHLISGIRSDFALKIGIGPILGAFSAAIWTPCLADTTTYKSRCIIIICHGERYVNNHGKAASFDERLDGAIQDCEIELSLKDGKVKIQVPEPFIFEKRGLLVDVFDTHNPNTKSDVSPSMSVTRGLAKKYIIVVKFDEPCGPVKIWPPFALETKATGTVADLLDANSCMSNKTVLQRTINEILKPHPASGSASTDIALFIGNKRETRLKLCYDIAWSIPPRTHNPRPKSRSINLTPRSTENISPVTYEFEFEVEGSNQRTFDSLKCIFCRKLQMSMGQLLVHLNTTHDEFQFQRCADESKKICVKEANSRHQKYRKSHLDRHFRLNPPRQAFDLERYLAGDKSWIINRYDNKDVQSHHQPCSNSVIIPRPESDIINIIHDIPKVPLAGPFYNSTSKEILTAGDSLLMPSVDETWLLKKHVDTLNDYSDVTASEKEYLTRWDNFILPQKLTANRYVAAALERFVGNDAEWFIGNEQRLAELAKHCTMFLIRGVIDVHCVRRVFEIASGRDREKLRRANAVYID